METIKGTFIKRYKRFFVDMLIDGQVVTCYTNNTGKMIGLLLKNAPCLLIDQWKNGSKSKFQYKWVAIQQNNEWVGVDTHFPNKIVKKILPQLFPQETFKGEVKIGNSRIDFVSNNYALEVKNVHWNINGIASFPDCVTTRGHKHMENFLQLKRKTVFIYVVQRFDVSKCQTNKTIDPKLYTLSRELIKKGCKFFGIKLQWTPQGVTQWKKIPYNL